jgi:hypothetical protein
MFGKHQIVAPSSNLYFEKIWLLRASIGNSLETHFVNGFVHFGRLIVANNDDCLDFLEWWRSLRVLISPNLSIHHENKSGSPIEKQ